MLPPGHVEARASAVWQGETVTARLLLPAAAWADSKIRKEVKKDLRLALAEAISERLDVTYVLGVTETQGRTQA